MQFPIDTLAFGTGCQWLLWKRANGEGDDFLTVRQRALERRFVKMRPMTDPGHGDSDAN